MKSDDKDEALLVQAYWRAMSRMREEKPPVPQTLNHGLTVMSIYMDKDYLHRLLEIADEEYAKLKDQKKI
jgi:hypothetical protein